SDSAAGARTFQSAATLGFSRLLRRFQAWLPVQVVPTRREKVRAPAELYLRDAYSGRHSALVNQFIKRYSLSYRCRSRRNVWTLDSHSRTLLGQPLAGDRAGLSFCRRTPALGPGGFRPALLKMSWTQRRGRQRQVRRA